MKFKIFFIALLVSGLSWGQSVYTEDFGSSATVALPYTSGTNATGSASKDANFTNPSWTQSNASASFAGVTGGSMSATIAASGGTNVMTCTFNVAAGYELNPASITYQYRISGSGPQFMNATISGTTGSPASITQVTTNRSGTFVALTSSNFTTSTTLTGTITIVIVFSATTANGSTVRFDNFTLNGTVTSTTSCTPPTSQASALSSNGVTTTTANLSWTDGAATSGTLVSLKLKASALTAPSSSTNYTPTLVFNTAAGANLIDANNVVVAKNNTETVTSITGLTAGTQYTATPYAYNGSGTNVCFNNTNPESFDFWTLATEPASHGAFTTCGASTATSIVVNFTAASTIPAAGYLLIYRQGAAPTGVPVDGSIYAPGSTIGDATVFNYIAPGATSASVTGLNGGSTYFFALIPFNAVAGPVFATINYRTLATIPTLSCSTTPAPEINVKGVVGSNPSIPDGDTAPSPLNNTQYATVVVGGNQSKNFRIENTGNADLTVSAITMVGGNNTEFVAKTTASLAIPFPLTITAGTSYDFTVTFTPTAAGSRITTLTIANTDSNENPYDFVIQGTGTVTPIVEINVKGNGQSIPDNSIYPSGTNWTAFPVTPQGGNSTRTFTIENLGSTALSLTGASPYIQITGPHASLFTVTAIPSNSIAGGASTTFDIRFSPLSGGMKNATITIFNNDTDEAVYNFNISGTCQGLNNIYVTGNGNDVTNGGSTTSTTNLTDFGLIPVTTGVKQNTFLITNLASSSRYFTNVTVSGANASMFTIVSQPSNNAIGAGNSTSFTINFTPSSAGVKNATVTFKTYTNSALTTTNAIDPPTYTFAISGEGIVYTPCSNNAVQTIAIQDFEATPATPTWNYNTTPLVTDGTVTIAGGGYNNGSGAVNAFIGAQSFQFKGIGTGTTRSAVLTLNAVDVSQYNNINFSMKVGAYRVITGSIQGLDVPDLIQIETSIDGGVNWSVESVLRGYNNSRWSLAATGVFNAYYTGNNTGVTLDTRNGNAELANGIATYNVKNLPQSTNLLIRITLNIDRDDELWALDNIKIEGQTAQSTIWTGASWSAGFPTPSTKAIFDVGTSYTTTAAFEHGSVEACELEIRSGATVTVDPTYYFEIQSDIKNSGTLTIANNGSLVQVNDTAINTGSINYLRNVASLRGFDYIYWSSPVVNQYLGTLYAAPTAGLKFEWNPIALNPSGSYGFWIPPTSSTMETGKGYIIRASSSYGWTGSLTSTFNGKPNNGVISPTLGRIANSAIVNDRWNLIGNPYPSSLDAKAFLLENAVTKPTIDGYIGLWQHLNAPASPTSPYYSTYQYNYTNDYLIYNRTGPQTQNGFNGYVASGQAFFVNLLQDPSPTAAVTFKNAFRSKTFDNSQFLRTSQNEEGRIWLDLVNSANVPVRALIGYVEDATLERDRLYDAITTIGINNSIHSLIGNEIFAIQGRPTPFDSDDQVPIGYNATLAGNYKIAIAGVDGFFSQDQPIYLEDKLLDVIFDLRQNPYAFTTASGTFNDRFILRYTTNTLGNPDFGSADNNVIVSTNHGQMTINSLVESIQDVTVYDILGRQLLDSKNIRNNTFVASNLSISSQTLIVKIKLMNGIVVTRKVML